MNARQIDWPNYQAPDGHLGQTVLEMSITVKISHVYLDPFPVLFTAICRTLVPFLLLHFQCLVSNALACQHLLLSNIVRISDDYVRSNFLCPSKCWIANGGK